MLLENKNAGIYGTAGAVGAAVAKAFAHEGARVFLTGRNIHALNRMADEIPAAGGVAETADVDALNEHAVTSHLDGIVGKAATVEPVAAGVGVRGMNAPGSVAEVPADAGSVAEIEPLAYVGTSLQLVRVARSDLHCRVRSPQGLTAPRADHLGIAVVTARFVMHRYGWPLLPREPTVAPRRNRGEHTEEVGSLVSQHILVPARLGLVELFF